MHDERAVLVIFLLLLIIRVAVATTKIFAVRTLETPFGEVRYVCIIFLGRQP